METTNPSQDGIRSTETLGADDLAAARAVLAAASAVDGREAVSEAGRLRLRVDSARPGVTHLVQRQEGVPAGYAQLEAGEGRTTVELTVHPDHRRLGLGRQLLDATLAEADAGTVDFWAHGGHPGAARLAAEYGAELVRELRQMRRPAEPVPAEPVLPEGVTVRSFRPGQDDAAWLRLNALAFAHHPEQGGWTEQDLAERLAEPWFDPAGLFLAFRGADLVGFHWTKVHPDGLGEVYVVAVDPAEQGSGLGRALTATGLRHLAEDRKVPAVLLYVDADNPAAVRVYERLGFTVYEVDLMYRVDTAVRR
ncbi:MULTISPECIES: mycothiol synthase [unclassified Kitasatospora]|uniref:mycothiol synthase n=1 Tax=unclassified Kitasatospora TaxID=2633591 RepID=UPI00070D1233|nr:MULTISPECIES: mycothiol synthase [unclassified Kitasatospora]KQV24333.1 mycothiol synthase [Kitasatospora sp. Root107]KRB67619.1 mycothiol synthase [Kitasatospora sp. Root187]